MTYDPQKHYWLVKSRTVPEKYFSSERGIFVAERDSLLKRFMADRGGPSVIASEQELIDVLKEQAPDSLPRDSEEWRLYLRKKIRNARDRRVAQALGADDGEHAREMLLTGARNILAIQDKLIAGGTLSIDEQTYLDKARTSHARLAAIMDAGRALEEGLDEDYENPAKWPA